MDNQDLRTMVSDILNNTQDLPFSCVPLSVICYEILTKKYKKNVLL